MSRDSGKLIANKWRSLPGIGEYVQQMEEYKNYPGKIRRGKMFILFHGKWISKGEFDKLVKPPKITSFVVNPNNSDKTKSWLYD